MSKLALKSMEALSRFRSMQASIAGRRIKQWGGEPDDFVTLDTSGEMIWLVFSNLPRANVSYVKQLNVENILWWGVDYLGYVYEHLGELYYMPVD
ncbi:hypothetical protein LguiA_021715 [Lonicera macranthoides]